MVLADGKSKFELELLNWDGDAYVSASVVSHGFSGKSDSHVVSQEFKHFCKSLLSLQTSLNGRAELNSISPDEIKIVIKPSDKLGHISVSGELGRHIFSANNSNWHCVQFEFEIEPQQLDKAVKIGWVNEHGI